MVLRLAVLNAKTQISYILLNDLVRSIVGYFYKSRCNLALRRASQNTREEICFSTWSQNRRNVSLSLALLT